MIKELLERWSQLEPKLCKRETRPNPFKGPDEITRFDVSVSYGWQTVYSHDDYYFDETKSLMDIQWAVQQAIIEKGWHFKIQNYHEGNGFFIKVESKDKSKLGLHYNNLVEGLLTAYLKVLDA